MLNSTQNRAQKVQLILFKDSKITKKEKMKEKKHHEMMKIYNKYLLFKKIVFENYIIYSNFKSNVTLPKNWKELGW